MKNKNTALKSIFQSIKDAKSTIGIKTFRWAADDVTIKQEELPCVFMGVGADSISQYGTRDYLGYPATRIAQVVLELVVEKGTDIDTMIQSLRKTVLTNYKISNDSIIRELSVVGPTGYNLPGIKGMSLILGLRYIDNGI